MPKLKAQSRRLCVKDRRLVCGCGSTGVPSCCTLANSFGFFPPATGAGFQANMSIDLSAAFTANGWTYQEAIGSTRVVAPTVTASVRHVVARTQVVSGAGVTACTNQGDIAELQRAAGGWNTVSLSTFSVEVNKSVSFSGASDIYDSFTVSGVRTIQRSFKINATLRHNKIPASLSGVAIYTDPGFNAAEVVLVVGFLASPFISYGQFDAANNVWLSTQACPGHEFFVHVDSAGKCRLDSTPASALAAGLAGTASVSGFSAGNATIAFDISTQSYPQPGAPLNKIAGVRFAGSVVLASTMQPCVPPVEPPNTNAAACASMIYQGTNLSYPPFPIPPAPGPVALPIVEPTDDPIDGGGVLLP